HAERDRPGADDHDLDAGAPQLGDLVGDRRWPAGRALGEQTAPDLEHDPARQGELMARIGRSAHGAGLTAAATRPRRRRSNAAGAASRNGLPSADSCTSTAATARDRKPVLLASAVSTA